MEPDVKEQFERIGTLLEQSAKRPDSLERLIIDFEDGLKSKLADFRHEMQQVFSQLNARLDTQDALLDRQEAS